MMLNAKPGFFNTLDYSATREFRLIVSNLHLH
jgi:hypothetical protein